MSLFEKMRTLLCGDSQTQQQIIISGRSDGNSLMGIPTFVAPWILDYPRKLKCNDGTDLPIRTTSTLVTGESAYKDQIITQQIVCAIRDGYTPVVLSGDGREGEVFKILQTIYPESAINYISETNSDCYAPFENISHNNIVDFFYQMVMELQQQPGNGMLIKNYINVCVKVFFLSKSTVGNLINGQLDHMGLLIEIQRLYQSNMISEQSRRQFESIVNSAQSVSVTVFSVIQDYLCKMKHVFGLKPRIQIYNRNIPHIDILNTNIQNPLSRGVDGYNFSTINERRIIFVHVENEVSRNLNNLPNEQCFQWYLSKTFQMEINARPEIRNARILLVLENISLVMLNWFWKLIDLPNCVLLLNYDDFYSKIVDSQERRELLISKMERLFFFSVMNEQSAGWVSRMFGEHDVPKVVFTDQPWREWTDILIRPRTYTHDEMEKPWFSTHEIQHLSNNGIVYSKRDKIFKACYLENGKVYIDKKYKGVRVNFCTFSFR